MTQENPLNLYLGDSKDYKGRTLRQILAWSDAELEKQHDYIQVLFPGTWQSRSVPQSPVLDPDTAPVLLRDPEVARYVQAGLVKSFKRMLSFFALELSGMGTNPTVDPTGQVALANWFEEGNHNEKRITRILRCLSDFGLGNLGRAFSKYLKEVYPQHRSGNLWDYNMV